MYLKCAANAESVKPPTIQGHSFMAWHAERRDSYASFLALQRLAACARSRNSPMPSKAFFSLSRTGRLADCAKAAAAAI